MPIKLKQKGQKQVDIVLFTLHGYVFSEKYRILKRMFFFLYFCYISLFCKVCTGGVMLANGTAIANGNLPCHLKQ